MVSTRRSARSSGSGPLVQSEEAPSEHASGATPPTVPLRRSREASPHRAPSPSRFVSSYSDSLTLHRRCTPLFRFPTLPSRLLLHWSLYLPPVRPVKSLTYASNRIHRHSFCDGMLDAEGSGSANPPFVLWPERFHCRFVQTHNGLWLKRDVNRSLVLRSLV
jgi:hypothetical protein